MTIPRLYHPEIILPHGEVKLQGDRFHYLVDVLKIKKGEKILLFDQTGYEYEALVAQCDGKTLYLKITARREPEDEGLKVILAQSLTKTKKMDFIIEKACELGVREIIPFLSQRSTVRLAGEKRTEKRLRWQRIAQNAAKMAYRGGVPEISACVNFREMLSLAPPTAMKIIFWEEEHKRGLKQLFLENGGREKDTFFLVIGPEGGFGPDEIEMAKEKGFVPVSLGKRILKVETAALVALSVLRYEKGL